MITVSPSTTDVVLADSAQLDAFGRLKVSMANTLFDSQQEYGLDTRTTWDATANGTLAAVSSNGSVSSGGNAVGPRDSNTRLTPITVSATNGHYAVLQSRQYTRYIPGKGHLIYITGIFAAGANATLSITRRTKTSGSVVDNSVAQASWNMDKLNGTGPSGVTIDCTKVQIMVIDAQMLYAGRIRAGFDIGGEIIWAHYFLIANVISVPSVQTFNLPIRMEGRTGASSTTFNIGYFDADNGVFFSTTRTSTSGTAYFECASVQSDGGEEARGFPWSIGNGVTTIGVTTRRPILSIRNKATFNSLTNRAHIEAADIDISASTNSAYYEIVIGGTLTGAAWTSVATDSTAEYDVTATAISGGSSIIAGNVPAGTGAAKGIKVGMVDIRNPLVLSQIDALTASQYPLTVVCTSFSGTSNVSAAVNWHEQVI